MKTKLLLFALLLMGVSAGAQTPIAVSISDDCSKNGKTTELRPSGTENGYTWVNMGLSVLWATMNVGATLPKDKGNYYAWGEVTTKTNTWITYLWCNGSYDTLTKYCAVDNKTTLEPADDAAHVNWGGNWRMPTDAEWTELRTQCTWTWTSQGSFKGYRVTATNGNSIFLPAAGYRYDTHVYDAGSEGQYWSSSLHAYSSSYAYSVNFNTSSVRGTNNSRNYGLSVRPVCP